MWLWIFSGLVCLVLYIIRMSSTYLLYTTVVSVSNSCMRCILSRFCKNISVIVLEMGDLMETPFSVW